MLLTLLPEQRHEEDGQELFCSLREEALVPGLLMDMT
jgi:hypothetical protein